MLAHDVRGNDDCAQHDTDIAEPSRKIISPLPFSSSLSLPSQVRKVRKRERDVWGIAVHERVKISNPPSRARARIIVWRTLVFDRSSPRERGKFAREYSALRREITSAWCLSARRAAYIYVYIRMYCAWSRMILCVNLCWKPGWRVLFFYAIFTHRCNFDALSGRRAHTKGVYFSAGLLKKRAEKFDWKWMFFFSFVYIIIELFKYMVFVITSFFLILEKDFIETWRLCVCFFITATKIDCCDSICNSNWSGSFCNGVQTVYRVFELAYILLLIELMRNQIWIIIEIQWAPTLLRKKIEYFNMRKSCLVFCKRNI